MNTPNRKQLAEVVHDPVRLGVLRETGLLDTSPEESFDRLTHLAAKLLEAPAAFIALIDEERDFLKSSTGLVAVLSGRRAVQGDLLTRSALLSGEPLAVRDVRAHPALRDLPAEKTLGVVAFAAAPLVVRGAAIGSFHVLDFRPRDWSATALEILVLLARSTACEIELRMALRAAEEKAAQARAPISEDEERRPPPENGLQRAADRQRVLIADDDPGIRALVRHILSADGLELVEAEDGFETLECMRRGVADLVLLDLHMPKLSGWDVLLARATDETLRQVPVIVVSARRGPDVARALAGGAYALLAKPFELQALRYIVRNCLAETRAARAV